MIFSVYQRDKTQYLSTGFLFDNFYILCYDKYYNIKKLIEEKFMSITRQTTEKSTKDRNDAEIAFKEFLKKGGKVETIPEGLGTDAADMKYKFRKPPKRKVPKED